MRASSPRRERNGRTTACCAALCLLLAGCGANAPADRTATAPDVATRAESAPAASSPERSPAPLVTATPDDHSEVGDLVAGFPSDLLPLPDDAVLLVTSAVPVGGSEVQEVSLNLRTAMQTDAVLELYRSALTAAGFTETPTDASGLTASASFTRSGADELVTLGVLDDGDLRTVTIGGRLRATP